MADEDVLKLLKDGPVKDWYSADEYRTNTLAVVYDKFTKEGYELDPEGGVMVKHVMPLEMQKDIGHTSRRLVIPRPVDLHSHEGVSEFILTKWGYGILYTPSTAGSLKNNKFKAHAMFPEKYYFVPKKLAHCFAPNPGHYLELNLECSGDLDKDKEFTLKRFDQWDGARLVDEGL